MHFVSGLPSGVYVAQTRITHAASQAALQPELAGFNLALHVGDEPFRVQQHRMALLQQLSPFGVVQMTWLNQTHSTVVYQAQQAVGLSPCNGDALVTTDKAHALMIMTADCLPIVLGNAAGTEVANLHAGWRGLAQGIIEQTIANMSSAPTWAWFGAAISQEYFEIGAEVKDAFCDKYPALAGAFQARPQLGKYHADLYAIARYILQQHGVTLILGADQCSYRQQDEYFSYRRHAKTGRMATFVFMR